MKKTYTPQGCDQQGRYESGAHNESHNVSRVIVEALVAAVVTVSIIVLMGVLQ